MEIEDEKAIMKRPRNRMERTDMFKVAVF